MLRAGTLVLSDMGLLRRFAPVVHFIMLFQWIMGLARNSTPRSTPSDRVA